MLTLRQKISQMLIMGCIGKTLNEDPIIKHTLSKYGLGGIILFDRNLKDNKPKNLINKQQIKELTTSLSKASQDGLSNYKRSLPLLIGIDYEGGRVDRLQNIKDCIKTKSAGELSKLNPIDFALEISQMAQTLKDLGFNLNFAPVIDLNLNSSEGIIGKLDRCFADDPNIVIELAKRFVEVFNQYGIICCYKHFPGHGSAIGDTHIDFVDVSDTFSFKELNPYVELSKEHHLNSIIMTAHVINRRLDENSVPATLSKKIVYELLQQKLNYQGVIVSDDLQMQAISKYFSLEETLMLTINAGVDMLIFANQFDYISPITLIDTIEKLALDNKISKQRILHAFQKIKNLKICNCSLL